jgi:hypothetical protein
MPQAILPLFTEDMTIVSLPVGVGFGFFGPVARKKPRTVPNDSRRRVGSLYGY